MVKMISRLKKALVFSAVMFVGFAMPLSAAEFDGDTTPKLEGAQLIDALKSGGYVIYIRHALTDKVGEKTVTADQLDKCDTQRNLSEAGREMAKSIGEGFKKNNIPVGDVFSSPYCRCVDTAKLAFGKATKSDNLHFAIHLPKENRHEDAKKLRDMMAVLPAPGTNTVLVSHTANLQEAVGIWPKHEGEANVFKADASGNISYIGKISVEDWAM